MEFIRFDKEQNRIADFLSLPRRLYSKQNNMEDAGSMKKLLLGTHVLSGYFHLDKFLVYDGNSAVGRLIITTYPDDDTAYLGFYECIDDDDTAAFLLRQAVSFCRSRHYRQIIGPVDASFWLKYRLKINLFDEPPYTGEPYNREYYYRQFLDNGFTVCEHYTSNCFHAIDESYVNEKFESRYQTFLQNGYRIESPDVRDFDKVIDDVYEMIRELYSDFPIYKDISREDFRTIYKSYQTIMNMSMTKIAYYDGKAVGFYISIPDYGNAVYHITPLRLLSVLHQKKHPKRYVMLYMGVRPEHQGLGKALVFSIIKELEHSRLTSIGALARDGKITQKYVSEEVTDVYEYVLLQKDLKGTE